MSRLSLLHVSDCHFGIRHHFRRLGENGVGISLTDAIEQALSSRDPITGLVISGDIFTSPAKRGKDELEHAVTDLSALIELLEIPPENVAMVPGNHDIERSHEQDPHKAFLHYDRLTKKLGAVDQTTRDLPQVKIIGADPPIALLLLNSCIAEGIAKPGIGLIGEAQRKAIRRKLEALGVTPASHVIVAVLHHHLLPIIDQELVPRDDLHGPPVRNPSLTTDASETLQLFSELGVSLVLHGHQHEPALLEYCDRMNNPTRSLTIAAAGSCGSAGRPGSKRHFWVHDIGAGGVLSTLYSQGRNPNQFKSDRAIQTRRAYADDLVTIDGCHVHAESTFQPGLTTERPVESDLSLVFMSVTDCPRARTAIREAVAEYRTRQIEDGDNELIELDGMYDLLGYWDLLVRLRIPHQTNPTWVFRALQRELKERGIQRDDDDFGDFRIVDVQWELPQLTDYKNRGSLDTVQLRRTQLPGTEEYDRLRSQRVLLYFKLPSRNHPSFLSEVASAIAKAGVGDIVETAAVGIDEVVLDIFLRCADSAAINRLNRAVEPVLGPRGCQKYTLLCYGYDEDLEPIAGIEPEGDLVV